MIKIKKRIIKEAEATTPAAQTTQSPNTTTEKSVDDAENAVMLRKFAQLPNTAQTIAALTTDFKTLTGDQKYKSLAQFLNSIGIDKVTIQSTLGKM